MLLDEKKPETNENDIQDIKLNFNSKKRFRIDNDSARILELDTSDLSVVSRLQEYYPKLKELDAEIAKLTDGSDEADEEAIIKLGKKLSQIDKKMRDYLDIIFDANVSETCAPTGSMYDPINGQLRYEHIISLISGLYEENLSKETQKIKDRISKHTSKYAK